MTFRVGQSCLMGKKPKNHQTHVFRLFGFIRKERIPIYELCPDQKIAEVIRRASCWKHMKNEQLTTHWLIVSVPSQRGNCPLFPRSTHEPDGCRPWASGRYDDHRQSEQSFEEWGAVFTSIDGQMRGMRNRVRLFGSWNAPLLALNRQCWSVHMEREPIDPWVKQCSMSFLGNRHFRLLWIVEHFVAYWVP